MTLTQFSQIFAVLADQLRLTDVDEPTIRAYFKPLQDLEVEFVALAADRFARGAALDADTGKAWFPKAPEWRALALKVERERADALKARLRDLPTPACLACDDTGWQPVETGGVLRCACRALRRLEVLGRRPMPALPSGEGEVS